MGIEDIQNGTLRTPLGRYLLLCENPIRPLGTTHWGCSGALGLRLGLGSVYIRIFIRRLRVRLFMTRLGPRFPKRGLAFNFRECWGRNIPWRPSRRSGNMDIGILSLIYPRRRILSIRRLLRRYPLSHFRFWKGRFSQFKTINGTVTNNWYRLITERKKHNRKSTNRAKSEQCNTRWTSWRY